MRISKLARTYNLSNLELTDFLKSLNIPGQSLHPNAKLSEEIIQEVAFHFDFTIVEEETPEQDPGNHAIVESIDEAEHIEDSSIAGNEEEASETSIKISSVTEEIEDEADEEISVNEQSLNHPTEQSDAANGDAAEDEVISPPTEEETILSDQFLEMIEADEAPAGLEKIRLIKAPKKELTGLTVLGKIEIPEDPRKKQKAQKEAERLEADSRRPKITEEEREKRRLKAKKKKEEYEARKERRLKQKEERKEKARKEEHYKNITQAKVSTSKGKPKKKMKPTKPAAQAHPTTPTPQPKTVFGKLWRWLNSSGYD